MRHHHPRTAPLLALLLLLLLPALAAAQETERPTMIVVVRHAERAAVEGRDPPLSEAGEARARALVEAVGQVVGEAGVSAIYASQYQRTELTARPLAERHGVPISRYEATSDVAAHAAELAREILEKHRGERVVVVGHSNTVPAIVQALGGREVPEIADSEYRNLFVVIIQPNGLATTVRSRFGEPR